jgi:peptidoglycan biosynthesis protein MviN/MurJ (putative lipid II flippase)
MQMQGFESMGKMLILMGLFVLLVGLIMTFAPRLRIPFLGRLPGDIRIEREGFRFYFPIVTCIVLSVLLTIVLNVVGRLLGR